MTLSIALASLLTLGLVVIIHELGHFLFCKLFGVYVKTFSIGIGPKVLVRRWGETEYALSAIPFGGYVKMAGEGMMEEIQDTGTGKERKYPLGTEEGNREAADLDEDIPLNRQFHSKPAWQRLIVFIAGPLFNLLLAFLIYTGSIFFQGIPHDPVTTIGVVKEASVAAEAGLQPGDRLVALNDMSIDHWDGFLLGVFRPDEDLGPGPHVFDLRVERDGTRLDIALPGPDGEGGGLGFSDLESANTTVGKVQKGGLAQEMGLQHGDVVKSVDGADVHSFNSIARVINDRPDQSIEIIWERGGVEMRADVVPQLDQIAPDRSVGRIFMEPLQEAEKIGLGRSLQEGYRQTGIMVGYLYNGLRSALSGEQGLDGVGGPLRIGKAAGDMWRWGFDRLMRFIAFFSVNLFLLNLLPIPVLDGGHVLFLIMEVVRGGKPVNERLQAIATQMGLIILLLFMTFVFVLDIWKVTGH